MNQPTEEQDVFIFAQSFAQERLWLIERMLPGSDAYHIPIALRLTGELNRSALRQSLAEIIERHEILRTTFTELDGERVQVFNPNLQIPLRVERMGSSTSEAEITQYIRGQVGGPFDLEKGPLLRLLLLELGGNQYIFVANMHHIISDGWSMGVFARELSLLYRWFAAGGSGEPPLPELEIQYGDFAEWQRDYLTGEVLERQLQYWLKTLADPPPPLELPTDRARPITAGYRGGLCQVTLDAAVLRDLEAGSGVSGLTRFMTLLAGYAVLLARYCGQDDIAVGTPVANRDRHEIAPLIGFFVNTLVMRVPLDGSAGFRRLMGQVKEIVSGAFSHQDLPFEKLVEALQPERHPGHSPVFQVMLALQNVVDESFSLDGLTISSVADAGQTAKFDLTLHAGDGPNGFEVGVEYAADLFDQATMQRFARHYANLFNAARREPDLPIARLDFLDFEEKRTILETWNATTRDFPDQISVHDWLQRHVSIRGHAAAVIEEGVRPGLDRVLDYAALNARAHALALQLKALGVRLGQVVGIYLERSLDMAVAVLGVLKAGAAYLPLGTNYPPARMRYMLADARVALLLTSEALTPPDDSIKTLAMEAVDWHIGESRLPRVPPESPAYIIYTSGSTGKPKGVVLHHRGMVNHAVMHRNLFGLTPACRLLQFADFSFDVSVWEMMSAWGWGGQLHIPAPATRLSGRLLIAYMRRVGITHTLLPPTMLGEVPHEPLPDLVSLTTGGEACKPEQVRLWSKGRVFTNAYGPTEVTVTATAIHFSDNQKLFPIGKPVTNARAYILSPQLMPVPIGVHGELYLAGVGLAHGYLAKPALTAERFIPDPFTREPGGRLYKSGDLTRYLPDGNIDYLGRIDHQIKIRGFRVEVGEIETILRRQAGVSDAVVLVHESPTDKWLTAYVTGPEFGVDEAHDQAETARLRRILGNELPVYMVPAHFRLLAVFPLLPNAKVDRKALFELGEGSTADQTVIEPRDETEERLLALWQRVLDREGLGMESDFFASGGHSLRAVRLMEAIRDTFQLDLPVTALFQAPTPAQLVLYLKEEQVASSEGPLVLMGEGQGNPLFCVHPIGGDILCYAPLAKRLNCPFYGLRAPWLAGGPVYEDVPAIAEAYIPMIRKVQGVGPYRLMGWSFGGLVAYETALQLQAMGETVAQVVLLDSHLGALGEADVGDHLGVAEMFLGDLAQTAGIPMDRELLPAFEGDMGEWLARAVSAAEQRGVTVPNDWGRGGLNARFEIYRRNLAAAQTYQPNAYSGHVILIQASDHAPAVLAEQEAGWRGVCGANLTIHRVSGNHYSLLREANLDEVVGQLH